jgi:PQ loop repeat
MDYYNKTLGVRTFFGAIAYGAFASSILLGYVSYSVLQSLQYGTIVIFSLSRIPQIYTNFKVCIRHSDSYVYLFVAEICCID